MNNMLGSVASGQFDFISLYGMDTQINPYICGNASATVCQEQAISLDNMFRLSNEPAIGPNGHEFAYLNNSMLSSSTTVEYIPPFTCPGQLPIGTQAPQSGDCSLVFRHAQNSLDNTLPTPISYSQTNSGNIVSPNDLCIHPTATSLQAEMPLEQYVPCNSDAETASIDSIVPSPRERRNAVFLPRSFTDAARKCFYPIAVENSESAVEATAEMTEATESENIDPYHDKLSWKILNSNTQTSRKSYSASKGASRKTELKIHGKSYDKNVNSVLYQWLQNNVVNPYPSPQAKRELMRQTGLSKMQLKNWFCNIRRRKLPSAIKRSKHHHRSECAKMLSFLAIQ